MAWPSRIAQPEDDLRASGIAPRLLSLQRAAAYLGISHREVQRLIALGTIAIVRLPSSTGQSESRRVLIDRFELDRLVEASEHQRHDAPCTIERVR